MSENGLYTTTSVWLSVVTGICMLVGLIYIVLRLTKTTSTPVKPLTKKKFMNFLTLLGFKVDNNMFSVVGMEQVIEKCTYESSIMKQDENEKKVVRSDYANDINKTIEIAKERLKKKTTMYKECMTPINNYRKGVETTLKTLVDNKITTLTNNVLLVTGCDNWMAFKLFPDIILFVQCSWTVTPDDLVDDEIYDLTNKDVVVENVAYNPADIKKIQEAYEIALDTYKTLFYF